MDAQELRNLQKAYLEVVENQQLDEAYKPEGRDKLIKKMGSLGKPDPGSTQKQNQVRADRAKKMRDKHHTSYVRPKSLPDGFGGPEWKSRKNKEKANKQESKKSFPNRLRRAGGQGIRDSYDYYDIILSHLLDEGYKIYSNRKVQDKMDKLKSKGDLKSVGRAGQIRDKLIKRSFSSQIPDKEEKLNRNKSEKYKRSKTVSDNTEKKKSFPNRLTRSDKQGIRDSYDYYDIILSHLLDEGYAETPEAAEAIMVNMSEEWRQSIVD
jgi:hypothetical protein